jgi:hypothetical protein
MPRNLVLPAIALMVLSVSARARDASAILGKTIDVTVEYKETKSERGSAATTTIKQGTHKIYISKTGRIFLFSVGETGYVFQLNKTVDLVSHPEAGTLPAKLFEIAVPSSAVTSATFTNGLLTHSMDTRFMLKLDHSTC